MGLVTIFFKVLEVSATASVIVLIILFLRSLCGKIFSSRLIYFLWLIFILKLVFPLSIPSPLSLENITDKYLYGQQYSIINMGNFLEVTVNGLVKAQKAIGIYDNNKALKKEERVYKQGKLITETKIIKDPAMVELSGRSKSMNWLLTCISLVWFSGFIISMIIKIRRNRKFKRFFIKHNYCEDEEIIRVFIQCKKEIGINKNIKLLTSGSIVPVIYGIFKPSILLPYDCKNLFSTEELRYILLHELEHYKQKDIFLYCVQDILKTMHWFNPLIHLGIRKMQDDSEVLCDLQVMKLLENKQCICRA